MKLEHKKTIYGFDCDMYGHVNNSNYLKFYEEARSEALIEIGLPLAKLIKAGIHIYLTDAELHFKKSIINEEKITIKTCIQAMSKVKSVWKQEIFNEQGNLCNWALITGVFVKNERPMRVTSDILEKFDPYIIKSE